LHPPPTSPLSLHDALPISAQTHDVVAAVEFCDVTRTYGKQGTEVRALDGMSTRFANGKWTAVMGPSGSGKSTLLHCAAGLESVTDRKSTRLNSSHVSISYA